MSLSLRNRCMATGNIFECTAKCPVSKLMFVYDMYVIFICVFPPKVPFLKQEATINVTRPIPLAQYVCLANVSLCDKSLLSQAQKIKTDDLS